MRRKRRPPRVAPLALALVLGAAACGVYGPPVRPAPPEAELPDGATPAEPEDAPEEHDAQAEGAQCKRPHAACSEAKPSEVERTAESDG